MGSKLEIPKIQKKIPRDVSDIHIGSKFFPIPMRIADNTVICPNTTTKNNGFVNTDIHYYTSVLYCLPT